jgi:hypothetical protein
MNPYRTWRVGRDSSVGIETRYGLDGPGIEFRLRRHFPHPSRPALGPTEPHIGWVLSLSWVKAAGAWRLSPTPSVAEVKERVGLYLYYTFGPSWPVLRRTLLSFTWRRDKMSHIICSRGAQVPGDKILYRDAWCVWVLRVERSSCHPSVWRVGFWVGF